ncbi:MAG: hypothetical protein AB3N16_10495 [Flavobacteriaceae bacterium]
MVKKGLLVLFVLTVVCCAPRESRTLEYAISPVLKDSVRQLRVELEFPAQSGGTTKLSYPDNAWGQKELHNCITDIRLLGMEGKISMQKDSGWIVVQHPKEVDRIKIQYLLQQDYDYPFSTKTSYRPVIDERYFHLFSHTLFAVPHKDKEPWDVVLRWEGFPEGYSIHNSFGSGERTQYLNGIFLEAFGQAIFVGGDFRVHKILVAENEVYLATRGTWIPFTDGEVVELLKNTITGQRDFWKDHSQPYFTVTMHPFPQERGSSFQGTGLTNSFATSMSNNGHSDIGQLVYLFNHELMHNWIGRIIENVNEEEQYWFSEGFTEYYTYKNIARNQINGHGPSYFIDGINETIRNLHGSPVREAPNAEINYDNFWGNRDYGKLPYYRGCLFAFLLDYGIQLKSNGEQSLDDLMRQILEDSKNNGQKLSHDYFLEVASPYLDDVREDFEHCIVQGKPLPLEKMFRALGLQYGVGAELYELGFELSDDRKEVLSVVPGSSAQLSGLRKGDMLFSRSIYYGDATQPVQLGILRDGESKEISFYPIKKAKVPQIRQSVENQKKLRLK